MSAPFACKNRYYELDKMKHPISNSQSGFTLVELAIVALIIGFLLAGTLAMLRPYLKSAQLNATRTKLETISFALADFAQQHGRLPCPAQPQATPAGGEPFGAPRGSGTTGDNVEAPCGTNSIASGGPLNEFVGIVPFRALGLDLEAIRDGYGNLITYAVSPVMAGRDNDSRSGDQPTQIHAQCRQRVWLDQNYYNPMESNPNLNPRNALLCCARFDDSDNNLRVLDGVAAGNNSLFTGIHSNDPGDYENMITSTNPVAGVPEPTNQLIAYVLVSHGANARGAYNNLGDASFLSANGQTGDDETQNASRTGIFVERDITNVSDNTYFDDIVLWRTNHQVVSAFGNANCARP